MIRLKLALMIIFVFGAYPITNYIYRPIYEISQSNEVLKYWNSWYLICLFIGFSMPVSIAIDVIPIKFRFEKIILNFILILLVGNIVDRLIFDINYFQWNDIISIILAIGIPIYKYYKK